MKAFDQLKGIMEKRGYLDKGDDEQFDSDAPDDYDMDRSYHRKQRHRKGRRVAINDSETTIYRPAIQPSHGSSSSEGQINISDDTVQLDLSLTEPMQHDDSQYQPSTLIDKMISDYHRRSKGSEGHGARDESRGQLLQQSRP